MAVTVDTAGVSSRERLAYWSQTRMFFALDVRAREDRPFGGRAWEHELGPVRVRRIAADGHGVRRTRRAIAADDPEQFELSLLLAGSQELHQADRDAVLGPGDLVCMDSSRPYRVSSPEAFEMLVFAVPKVLLRPHVDVVGARTASAIPARRRASRRPARRRQGDDRAAPARPGSQARDGRRGALHLHPLPAPAVRAGGRDGLGVDPHAAPRALPPGPRGSRADPRDRPGDRQPLGPAQPGALQPPLPRRLRDVAQRCARACKRSSLTWQTRRPPRRTVVA
jgi:AraC-like protein